MSLHPFTDPRRLQANRLSSADERDPSVLALGGGTFLVAYEKMVGFERRIAGRFVTFGRHRAAR